MRDIPASGQSVLLRRNPLNFRHSERVVLEQLS